MTIALSLAQSRWIALSVTSFGFALFSSLCLGFSLPPDSEPSHSVNVTPNFTTPPVKLPLAHGKAVSFGIKDCKVYRLTDAEGAAPRWSLLFKPVPYFLPQQCVREQLAFDGKYIQIEIGTQALGAGGCCTTYAAYRSQDGENWQVRRATSTEKWQVLDTPK